MHVLLYTVHVCACVMKPRTYGQYGTSKGAGQASKTKTERERDGRETHCKRPECINKHHELVRQVSEGQSTMIIDALPKALSSSILSFYRLQVC